MNTDDSDSDSYSNYDSDHEDNEDLMDLMDINLIDNILFNQNNYIKNLDAKILNRMCEYVYGWHSRILNKNLRHSEKVDYIEIQSMKTTLKNIFRKIPPIDTELIVYRGVDNTDPMSYGSEFLPGSYISASLYPPVALNFAGSIFYCIKVIPGSKIIPLYNFCQYSEEKQFYGEDYEVVLDKNFFVNCSIEKIDNRIRRDSNNDFEKLFFNKYASIFTKRDLFISNCVYGSKKLFKEIYETKLPGSSIVNYKTKYLKNEDNFEKNLEKNIILTKKSRKFKKI